MSQPISIAFTLCAAAVLSCIGSAHAQTLDPSRLSALIAEAQRTHPSIRAAEANAQAAGVDIKGARAGYLPYLSVTGAYGNNDTSSATASVIQPLYQGGLVRAQVTEAKAKEEEQRALLDQAVLEISLQVADAYLSLSRAEELLRQWQSYMARLVEFQSTIERRIANGISSAIDAQTVKTRISQANSGLMNNQSEVAVARSRLSALLQRDVQVAIGSATENELSADTLNAMRREELFNHHPSIRLQRALAEQQKAVVRQRKAALAPTLSAQYSRRLESERGDFTPDESVQLVLSAQTGNAYSGWLGSKSAKQRVQAAEFQIAAARRELRDQLRIQRTLRESARRQFSANMQAIAASESQRDGYFRQFKAGRKTWLEVLNAEREANQVSLDFVETRFRYSSATWFLKLNWLASIEN